jgi:hypothetical protein
VEKTSKQEDTGTEDKKLAMNAKPKGMQIKLNNYQVFLN